MVTGLSFAAAGALRAQDKSFTVTLVPPVHGKVQLTPALPPDGKYPAGTKVKHRPVDPAAHEQFAAPIKGIPPERR